jgi:hypothetical protein
LGGNPTEFYFLLFAFCSYEFAQISFWICCVFGVLFSLCAKQYLWGDLEESIIDAVFKTETFASSPGIYFLYWSVRKF